MDLRRLDCLVHEHIMGIDLKGFEWPKGFRGDDMVKVETNRVTWASVPRYSSELAAAWQVVEKMLDSDERDRFAEVVAKEAGFWTEESPEQNVLDLLEWLKDPENACLAALKAKGVEVPVE